jgi:hypothetical protein
VHALSLVILFIPVIVLVLIYRFLRRKPLWLKVPVGLCALIVVLIAPIWMMQVFSYAFSQCQEEGFFRKLGCGITQTYEEDAPYFRFLPSDEAMIEHFRKHRADFERLVQIYREDPSPPDQRGFWVPTPEAEEIMERLGVKWVLPDSTIWGPPDPYTAEAQQAVKDLDLIPKLHRGSPEARKFTGILIGYRHPPVKRLNEYFSEVNKGYYYTPAVPKVENGRILATVGGKMVFPTLNRYPAWLIGGECSYRQFESQWFLRMCQKDE